MCCGTSARNDASSGVSRSFGTGRPEDSTTWPRLSSTREPGRGVSIASIRICLYAYFPFDHRRPAGGVQRLAVMLARGLADAGASMRVVCPSGPGPDRAGAIEVQRVLRYRDGLPYGAAAREHDAARWLEATGGCDV